MSHASSPQHDGTHGSMRSKRRDLVPPVVVISTSRLGGAFPGSGHDECPDAAPVGASWLEREPTTADGPCVERSWPVDVAPWATFRLAVEWRKRHRAEQAERLRAWDIIGVNDPPVAGVVALR